MQTNCLFPVKKIFQGCFFFLFTVIGIGLYPGAAFCQKPKVKTGLEVLAESGFKILQGKRVGLVTNPTGVDSKLHSDIDLLFHAPGVHLVALFGPEHGIRGDASAGQDVSSNTDPVTGLPVYSLYGRHSKPTPDMLKNIDVLVYDIQDIGVRSYTFISTLGRVMEAAAENNIPLVVLDRPDPLGGNKVEGTPVHPGFKSFVSLYPIPYVYGLTSGELARYLNGEHLLENGEQCQLTVVKMKGWRRKMTFSDTGLPWVPTSPHIPYKDTPEYYVATGIMGELGVLSEGVGYTLPFRMLGASWMNGNKVALAMRALDLPGVMFRPVSFRPYYGRDKGNELHGVQVMIINPAKADLMQIQFAFMQVNHQLYPNKNPFVMADSNRIKMFDKVLGTDQIRKTFEKRFRLEDIKSLLNQGLDEYRKKARKYYLYR